MGPIKPSPRIIIDTSYIVEKLNAKKPEEFLEVVNHINQIKGARIIIPVLYEIHKFMYVEPQKNHPAVVEGYKIIRKMKNVDVKRLERDEMYRWFNRKSHDVGHKLGKEAGPYTISPVDRAISAYTLYKATTREVILASRDRNLVNTVQYIERIASPVLRARGYAFPTIKIAKNLPDLQHKISQLESAASVIKTTEALLT